MVDRFDGVKMKMTWPQSVYIAQLNPTIGAIEANCSAIAKCIDEAKNKGYDLVVCPEMAICGYIPDDLLLESGFVESVERAVEALLPKTKGTALIVGTVRKSPDAIGKPLKNSAAVIVDGKLLGYQDKSLLPTYDVFDEWRYFEPGVSQQVWEIAGAKIGITICEDLWPTYDHFCRSRYQHDPLQGLEDQNLDLLINISASPYSLGKIEARQKMAMQAASRLQCPVILVNQVGAQDGLLFDGSSLVVSASEELLFQAASFSVDCFLYHFDQKGLLERMQFEKGQELFLALCMGLKDYFAKQGFSKACLGLSGGIDSAVVTCIAVVALGKENVLGVLLPSRFTSVESREDALALADSLGIETHEIGIEGPLNAFIDVLEPVFGTGNWGVTQENLQSRIRGTLLMAISNQTGHLLLNTGNKSELAVGFTTLYGDSCGAISVLGDLLKHQVYEVAAWINEQGINSQKMVIPNSIITKEPTAELRDGQKDSDTIPEYPILDVIVEQHIVHGKTLEEIAIEYDFALSLVEEVVRKIYANEYKRRQVPFALRVSEKAFYSGRRVPIVQRWGKGSHPLVLPLL